MPNEYKKGGVTEAVVGLIFHPRPWVPDNLRESTNVVIKCLLSKSPYYLALVVDAAYPQSPLPKGLAEGPDSSATKRDFRMALREALRIRLDGDVRPIANGVVDWKREMSASEELRR